jgi:hypothetical protein
LLALPPLAVVREPVFVASPAVAAPKLDAVDLAERRRRLL